MEMLEIGLLAALTVCVAQALRLLPKKMIPLNRNQAVALALIIAVVGVGMYDWAGLRSRDYTIGEGGAGNEPQITTGVAFEADGTAGTNTVYDVVTKTFTCAYVENTTADNVGIATSPYTTLTTCTGTITLYRTDTLASSDNAVSKISANVPLFYGTSAHGENANVQYAGLTKNSAGKYDMSFAPAGITARDEYCYFTIASGGSKAITFTATVNKTGLVNKDNFGSTTIQIDVVGLSQPFYLRLVKVGEVQ